MAEGKIYTVKVRRKRKGQTNYKRRMALLKSGSTRLVVRRSNKYIMLQLVDYAEQGDKVLTTVSSAKLGELGWKYSRNSLPAAYLTGLLLAKKAAALKPGHVIVDLGFLRSIGGNKLYAAVKGALDGGLEVECDASMFPSEERLSGAHIAALGASAKERFSGYAKAGADPAKITDGFAAIKAKIIQ